HQCPETTSRGGRGSLNDATAATSQPIPRQSTDTATKAFVLSFTEWLHQDLRGTGVTATALCPGPTKTEFAEVAGIDENLMEVPGLVYSAQQMARAGVSAVERGRRTVVPGPANRIGALAGRVSPRAVVLEVLDRFYPVGK